MTARGRRATALALVMFTAAATFFAAPGARAAGTGFTEVRYSFDSDSVGSRPSRVTVQAGDVEVIPEIPLGQSMRARTKGGPWNVTAARFDDVIASRISVVWQETALAGGDSHGFTLRHTEEIGGYLFLVNGLTTYEPNTVGIYKVRSGTVRKLASTTLAHAPRRTFTAEADGDKLTLYYRDADAGVPTSPAPGVGWTKVLEYKDYEDPIAAGGLQYTAGWNGSDATRTSIDFMTAYVLPVAGVIDLITPAPNQIVQRSTTGPLTDVTIQGGYAGTPSVIQARAGSGPWVTIDTNPKGGRFSGVLPSQPVGQGTIEVRFANMPSVTDTSTMVGIGDVFVIAGQSNAVGHGWSNQPVSHPTWRAGMFGNDYRWKPLADPLDSPAGQIDRVSEDSDAGGSVWPLVATKLMADQNVPVAFIPTARNGTWIGQWQREPNYPANPETLYGSMISRAMGAGKVRAVLFWQGESDAKNGMGKAQYRQLLDQFASDVRRDIGAPVVVAQIGEGDMPAGNLDPVRLAQRESWDAGTTVAGPSLYDVHPKDDGVHFRSDPELAIAAHRWFHAVRAGLYGVGDGRGPRLVSAYLGANRATVTVKLADPSGVAGGSEGFSVLVGGSPAAISSVSRPASDTFVLNLASAAGPATITVSLGKGHDGADRQVPADGNGLPAEIFVDVPVAQ